MTEQDNTLTPIDHPADGTLSPEITGRIATPPVAAAPRQPPAAPEAVAEPLPMPYAVFRCRYRIPYNTAQATAPKDLALDLLRNLAAASVQPEVGAFLTDQQRDILATTYASAMGTQVASLRPVTFLSPTYLSDVAMRSEVVFSYNGPSDELVIEWRAAPVVHDEVAATPVTTQDGTEA